MKRLSFGIFILINSIISVFTVLYGAGNNENGANEGAQKKKLEVIQDKGILTSNEAFVRMLVSKNRLYENEALIVTIKLYTLHELIACEDIKMQEFKGFLSQEIGTSLNSRMNVEKINGKNYRTYTLGQSLLYPQYTGKVRLPEGKLTAVLWVRTEKLSLDNLDDFSNSYSAIKKTI